jgi:hypothetical protein
MVSPLGSKRIGILIIPPNSGHKGKDMVTAKLGRVTFAHLPIFPYLWYYGPHENYHRIA